MKKKVNLNLKEKAREKLLKLNAKIKELLEKPEFEWEEKPGLGGSTFVVRGKEGYSAEGFLKNNFEKVVEIPAETFWLQSENDFGLQNVFFQFSGRNNS